MQLEKDPAKKEKAARLIIVNFLKTSHTLAFLLDCPELAGPSPPLLLSPNSVPRLPAPLAHCSPHPPHAHWLFSQLRALVHALRSAMDVFPLLLSSSSTFSSHAPLTPGTPTPALCCHPCVTSSRAHWLGLPLIRPQVCLSQAWPGGVSSAFVAEGLGHGVCLANA